MITLEHGKQPNEVVTFWVDFGNYEVDNLILSASVESKVYLSNDSAKTDIPSLHPWDAVCSGSRVYQTVCSGSDGIYYIWHSLASVSGSNDIYESELQYLVKEE